MPENTDDLTSHFLQVSGISLLEGQAQVLQNINLTQAQFCKLAIAGETGSGKSTLLQTIAGLVQPSSGNVWFEQKRVKGPQEHLIPGHPGIAYLSQQFELPQFLRVEQILQYANKIEPETAENLFQICRISHLLSRRTSHLSGGERQRIALARLVLSSPRLLLLDEPFSNLDVIHKNILKKVIQEVSELLDITCILISHDPQDTLPWADEIIVMQAGEIIQQGTPVHIYQQPVNEYAAGLFGKFNLIAAEAQTLVQSLELKHQPGKKLLIRPEQFIIHKTPENGLAGKVNKVAFFGSYYELEIIVSNINLTVKIDSANFKVGDAVGITLKPEVGWYI